MVPHKMAKRGTIFLGNCKMFAEYTYELKIRRAHVGEMLLAQMKLCPNLRIKKCHAPGGAGVRKVQNGYVLIPA
jgi:hypothetical protein